MQHPNIFGSDDVHKHTIVHVSNFDEMGFECKDIWIENGKICWSSFPGNHPIRTSSPTVSIDEEGVIGVAQKEFASNTFYMHRFDALFALNKVKRRVGLV
jgi:hypothetical protein